MRYAYIVNQIALRIENSALRIGCVTQGCESPLKVDLQCCVKKRMRNA